MTSSDSFLDFLGANIESNASELEGGGTVVETERGRWREKNDAM
jgi:flagellar biosynthesis chaperone FliJ